ncbi:DUF1877 family protein [Thiolinea disciformis]|uniref:DUF1877 family protein n=1 Tax=Thiolinea disciformis TaxID=125614 RepID=UPI0003725160|nr:DUF1877 family protein [Thiolinea disciformis]
MSLGGAFYILSDDQLERLLDGSLSLSFLYNELDEKPREAYSVERAWLDVIRIVEDFTEDFAEQTNEIPEMSQYSWATDVKEIAPLFVRLNDDEVESYYNWLDDASTELAELSHHMKNIASLYQRAAQQGDAVLFRVT